VLVQMEFKKIIKRMVALGTGASMVGATIFGAYAAELADYPSQFISDGKFTGVLVVGDKAAAEDVIGVSDIAVSLQFAATRPVSVTGGGSISATGDAWLVRKGTTNVLELTENPSTLNTEAIATITSSSFIDDTEMSSLLASLTASNSKGDSPYDQRLYFEDTTTGFVQLVEDREDVTADFLYFVSGKQIARYELEFTTALESDVDDSAGSATTSGLFLTDIEDTEITMLGTTFTIVQARRTNAAGNNVKLILMGGAVSDTVLEGNTKTYTIDGTDFEVSLDFVDADSAKFTINGEGTRDLLDGETDKMSDGTVIGISEILYQAYAGGVHSVSFFLGAQKMELRDTNIKVSDGSGGKELKVDDETIDGAVVEIQGTDDNTTFKIDKIIINMTADDDYYVPVGGKLSENPELDEADLLFTKGWDIEYRGLSDEPINIIQIRGKGSDDYELEFVDGKGNVAKIPLINAVSGSIIRFGDNNDDLIVEENKSITKDDYFIITDYSDKDGERQSFALRYRGSDKISSDSAVIKFDELGSGERIERTLSVGSILSGVVGPHGGNLVEVSQIKLGGGVYRIYNTSSAKSNDFNIVIDLNASQTIDHGGFANAINLNTQFGASILIQNQTEGVIVTFDTPNTDDFDDLVPTDLIFNLTATSGEVRLAKAAAQTHTFLTPDDDDKNTFVYTSYGAFVRRSVPTSDPQEVFIEYPQNQRLPLIYITGEGVTFTQVAATTTGAVSIQRIDVGATKLASEVPNINAVNSILVGGPCANAASSTVMGDPAECTEGFTPGVGQIHIFDVGSGNVAMLVAGFSAADTRNAAAVLANYQDYADTLKGEAVEVTKVNNVLTVTEPSAPAAEEEEPAAE